MKKTLITLITILGIIGTPSATSGNIPYSVTKPSIKKTFTESDAERFVDTFGSRAHLRFINNTGFFSIGYNPDKEDYGNDLIMVYSEKNGLESIYYDEDNNQKVNNDEKVWDRNCPINKKHFKKFKPSDVGWFVRKFGKTILARSFSDGRLILDYNPDTTDHESDITMLYKNFELQSIYCDKNKDRYLQDTEKVWSKK